VTPKDIACKADELLNQGQLYEAGRLYEIAGDLAEARSTKLEYYYRAFNAYITHELNQGNHPYGWT